MKWYSVKTHIPPMDTVCLIFTENNYFYLGMLIDSSCYKTWVVDADCESCGSITEKIYGVTHFCIPDPIEQDA